MLMSFVYANIEFMLMSCVYVNQPSPTDPAEAGLGLVALMTWERGVCDRRGMTAWAVGILVFTCILTVRAFYSSTNVIKLTSINFNSQVIQSDKLWLVEFYVHWCEHCERFVPEWIKVALALKGIVKVGAIDVTKYASIGHQYEIEEFPTIKFFGVNKNKPEKYYGGRSSAAITNGVLNSIRFIVRERLIEKSSICGSEGQCRRIMNKDAFELNDSNFDNQVAGGDEIWIVEFYAPWCEHCLSQEPTWTNAVVELARRTKGKIHLAAVDSSINVMLATRFGIQEVPTIKIFQTNKKIVDYNGEKSAPSIIAAGLELYSKMPLYKPFQQMVSEEILKTVCGLRVLCIIAVLPHISDTGNSGRSDYLGLLMKIAHKYKKKKWGWLWTESGAQPKLESALGIGGLAYPNIIAIDPRRKKYMFLKGSFSERGIAEFFRKLSMGHVSRIPMSDDFPKVKTVKCWDSKEGELPKEDPILLSGPTFQELENDELGKVFEYQDLKPGWLKAHGLPDSNDSWPPLYYSDMDYLQQATQSTGELPPMLPPQSFNATSKISKPISASSFRPTIGSDDHIF